MSIIWDFISYIDPNSTFWKRKGLNNREQYHWFHNKLTWELKVAENLNYKQYSEYDGPFLPEKMPSKPSIVFWEFTPEAPTGGIPYDVVALALAIGLIR